PLPFRHCTGSAHVGSATGRQGTKVSAKLRDVICEPRTGALAGPETRYSVTRKSWVHPLTPPTVTSSQDGQSERGAHVTSPTVTSSRARGPLPSRMSSPNSVVWVAWKPRLVRLDGKGLG